MDCAGGVCELDIDDITAPVMADMEQMRMNLRDIVGRKNPLLLAAADQIFGAGGKRLRPVLVFLVARATAQLEGLEDITDRQRRLAEITEMIHTASLVHDDVLDDCDTRRGAETIHTLYARRRHPRRRLFVRAELLVPREPGQPGGDQAHLAGDRGLRGRRDLAGGRAVQRGHHAGGVPGEVAQQNRVAHCGVVQERRSCSCGVSEDSTVYEYGKHLGLAFQVVDDILDFTQTEAQLGKPQGQDLATGNLTAPILFALRREDGDELRLSIQTQFEAEWRPSAPSPSSTKAGSRTRRLAREEADMALSSLKGLPEGEGEVRRWWRRWSTCSSASTDGGTIRDSRASTRRRRLKRKERSACNVLRS